mgnify:CR=1 FL=1
MAKFLVEDEGAAAIFIRADGREWEPGDRLVQSDLAASLSRIAKDGRAGFYDGSVAAMLVEEVRGGNDGHDFQDLKITIQPVVIHQTTDGLRVRYSTGLDENGIQLALTMKGKDLPSHDLDEFSGLAFAEKAAADHALDRQAGLRQCCLIHAGFGKFIDQKQQLQVRFVLRKHAQESSFSTAKKPRDEDDWNFMHPPWPWLQQTHEPHPRWPIVLV